MNRFFKTVRNAIRGVVVVDETRKNTPQGSVSTTRKSKKQKTLTLSAVCSATLMALGMAVSAPAAAGNVDATYDYNIDVSGGYTNHVNVTVEEGATLTLNDSIELAGDVFTGGEYVVDQTLTNRGTIVGDGAWTALNVVNSGSFTTKTLTLAEGAASIQNNASSTFTVTNLVGNGTITNAGTMSITSWTGVGAVTNEATGSLTFVNDYTLGDKMTNAGTLTMNGLTVASGTEFENTATSGVNIQNLTVTGTVSGATGVMNVAQNLTVNSDATFTQGTVNLANAGSNAGTMTANTLNLQNSTGTFTNAETGVLTVNTKLDLASGRSFANAGSFDGKEVAAAGTSSISNTGTKFEAESLTLTDTASFANTAATGVAIDTLAVNGGSVTGEGSMTVSTALTTGAGTSFAQKNVTANGTTSIAGTFNVTEKLTTTGKATFAAGATGTVANADVNDDLEHAGTMTFTAMDAAANLTNTAGTLRIDALTGTAVITNAEYATLDLSRGSANAAASLTNSGTATVKDTTFSGAVANNAGSLTGTGTITSGSFTNAAEANLVNLTTGTITASGETNVTGKLTGSSTAVFDTTATGTIAEADITGNITHSGSQTFTTLANSAEIANNAGTLTVGTLTGASAITNADGATLAFANGTQQAASLNNQGTANLGTFTATGNITNTKDLTSTGLVTAANYSQTAGTANVHSLTAYEALTTAGTFTATGAVSADTGSNTGTFSAGNLAISTSYENSSSLTSTGTASITNFTQSAGSSTFNNATLGGTGSLAGTVTASGALTFADNSSYSGAGSIDADAALNVLGNVTMTGNVSADGTTTVAAGKTLSAAGLTLNETSIAGNLTANGTSSIADLSMSEGAKLTATGALTVTTGTALDKVTYEQSGAGSITFEDGKWFSNSTINVFGGSIARGENGLGTGNTYVIKRESVGDITDNNGQVDESWDDNRTIVSVNTLDMNNTVTLQAGGVLDVSNIAFTTENEQTKYLNFEGGALSTTLDQIFEDVASDALDMEAVNPETGRIEITGSAVGLTSVGKVKDAIAAHTDFNLNSAGGDIVFNDSSISVDLVAAVAKQLTAVGATNIDVHYTGSTAQVFDADVANKVIDNNSGINAIFDTSTLYAQNTTNPDGGKTLHVGTSAIEDTVNIKGTIGFRDVANTENIKITDGLTFALIGTTEGGNLIGETGGTVEVSGAGSTFMLGTLGRSEALTGTVAKVTLTDGGRLFGKGKSYTVTEIDAQSGTVETGVAGTINTNSLKLGAAGVLTNAGVLNATAFEDVAGAQSTNTGALKVTNAAEVKGMLTTAAGAATVFENRLTVSGKVVNNSTGRAAGLQVAGIDITADKAFENSGNFVSTSTNNITGGTANKPASSTDYAFHNKQGGVAQMNQGKTTIGAAVSTLAAGDAPASVIVVNQGTMQLAETEVLAGGDLRNLGDGETNGIMTGTKLSMNVGSFFANSGSATFDEADFNGTVRNKGTITVGESEVMTFANTQKDAVFAAVDKLNVKGSFTNGEGAYLLANTAHTTVAEDAEIDNDGTAVFKTLRLMSGASFLNSGDTALEDLIVEADSEVTNEKVLSFGTAQISGSYINKSTGEVSIGDSMTINANGSYTNQGSSAVVNKVTVNADGALNQEGGSFTIGNLVMEGGAAKFTGGTFNLGETTFNSGKMIFAGVEGAETPLKGTVALTDNINGTLAVDNAVVTVGKFTPIDTASVDEAVIPTTGSVLVADTAPITLGATGKLAVGEGAEAKAEQMTAGSAWFGNGSTFVIDTSKLTSLEDGGTAALVGSGDLSVDQGAQIHFANVGWGTYYVTKDFADETLAEGSWEEYLSYSPTDPAHGLTITQDEEGNVLVTVGSADITDKLGDVVPENIYNEVISTPGIRDTNRKDVIGLISKAVEDGIIDASIQKEVIDASATIGVAGALMPETMTLVGNVNDITERHLSFEDAHFANGQLRTWDGVRVWADALGQRFDRGASGTPGAADYDGTNYGFVIGADLMAGEGWRFGASFAAQKGDLETKNSSVTTENDSEAYSLSLYGAKNFGSLNLIGHVGYTFASSDISQTLPSAMELGAHEFDVDSNVLSFGVRAEYHLALNEMLSLVPYVGVRNITLFSNDESSKLGGVDAYHYDMDTVNVTELPIGLALQSFAQTQSGWTIRTVSDLSVIPAVGDTDTDVTMTANGLKASDTFEADVAEDVRGAFRLGFSAEKDTFMFGGNVGLSTSGSDDTNVTFGLQARYSF